MVGIIGAMEEEVEKLTAQMEDVTVTHKAGMAFHAGTLCGRDAVVVRSGIGKVNAGICTQILADLFHVDMVINTGIAGSLNAHINIGDIVLSSDSLQHDVDAAAFGYGPGIIPRMETSVFPADERLLALAKAACEKVNPEIQVFTGRVVSGDQFIADSGKKQYLLEQFHPMCTEMEGAAIAQAAYLNRIPYLIIRAISDKADGSAQMDYPVFEAAAIKHTVKLVLQLCNTL
ncbi:MAG: 5'-methylthioadenosine/adenosylhomocysteine nucleosidase [Lachnospiraceae bacterium]|nr:5'-methylthioadenosine/adenosylhomocysteine nucleosidase [Lachnospiraceae bacterium]